MLGLPIPWRQGAKEIFQRSIEKYGWKYVEFVGDGDSGCFGTVREVCEKRFARRSMEVSML